MPAPLFRRKSGCLLNPPGISAVLSEIAPKSHLETPVCSRICCRRKQEPQRILWPLIEIDAIDGHDEAAEDKSACLNRVIGTTLTILIFDEAVTGLCPILLLRSLVRASGGNTGELTSVRKHATLRVCEGTLRMRPDLRIYVGSPEPDTLDFRSPEVTIKLSEFSQILADAIIWDRTWVCDFADEEIRISADLYEVLSVYAQMRPSA